MAKRDLDTDTGAISSDSLCTPRVILDPLRGFWNGPTDCDPCSNEHSIVGADLTYTFGGLHRPWGARTYQNHPYSTNAPWIAKAIYEMDEAKRVRELVILCMVSTSTAWWSDAMNRARRNPRVICTKRLKFLGPDGVPLKDSARFDTALIYYGKNEARFDRYFRHLAVWSTRGR